MIEKIWKIICCGKPPKEKYEKIKKDIKTGRGASRVPSGRFSLTYYLNL